MKNLAKSSLFVLGSILGSFVLGVSEAKADTVTYDFEVSNLVGDFSGQTFSGSFSFDDEASIGTGGFSDELDLFELTSFEFNFDDSVFALNSLNQDSSGAAFFGDEFVGLEVSETDSQFSIFDDGFGSVFAYESGFGEVSYTLAPEEPEAPASVPDPSMVFGILGTGAAMLYKKRSLASSIEE